jgi:hypothetical protein
VARASHRSREFGFDRGATPQFLPQESPLQPLIPTDTTAVQGARPGTPTAPPTKAP